MELLISKGAEFQIMDLMWRSHGVKVPVEAWFWCVTAGFFGSESGIFVYFVTAVTIASGPLQPHGTDGTGPMANPEVCALV